MQPFSILMGLGALLGLLLIVWRVGEKEASRNLDAALWVLVGVLVGSRALFVGVNFTYYQNHPWEIIQVWQGGLSGIGAMAGGMVTMIILARWRKLPTGKLADTLLPLAGALAITAWLGGWVDGCGYGAASDQWWALPAGDEWGMVTKRVPVQLLGASLTLVVVWVLDWIGKRIPIPGFEGAVGLFGISAVICGLSFLRVDPSPVWYHLRLETWGAIGLILCTIALLVASILRWKSQINEKDRMEKNI